MTGPSVLLPPLESVAAEPAVTELLRMPLAGAWTVMVRVVLAPLSKLPREDQMTWLPLVVAAGVALTNVTLAGRESVTTRLVALLGPALLTTMV